MKTKTILSLIAMVSFTLAGCTSDDWQAIQNYDADDKMSAETGLMTLVAGTGTSETSIPDTRIVYEEYGETKYGVRPVAMKWKSEYRNDDCIYLVDKAATTVTYGRYSYDGQEPASEGAFRYSGSSISDPNDKVLSSSCTSFYAIHHEKPKSYGTAGTSDFGFYYELTSSYDDTQESDNSMEHLSARTGMKAEGTCKDGKTTNTVIFRSLMAMVSLKLTLPEACTPVKVALCCTKSKILATKAFNLADDVPFTTEDKAPQYRDRVSVNLKSSNFTDVTELTVHYLLIPDDLSQEDLYVKVTCDAGGFTEKIYTSDLFKGGNFEAGKRYGREIAVSNLRGESADTPILLRTKEDLLELSDKSAYIDEIKYFRLENDVDLNDEPFKPILAYELHLDGGNHAIRGLNVFYKEGAGLISCITGSVENLKLQGTIRSATSAAGALAGTLASPGYIRNIEILEGTTVTADVMYAGGIIGSVNSGILKGKLISAATVNGHNDAGGIIGYVNAFLDLKECTLLSNSGNISANSNTNTSAGGLFGSMGVTETATKPDGTPLSTFSNSGQVVATTTGSGYRYGNVWAGGFAGNISGIDKEFPKFISGKCTGNISAIGNISVGSEGLPMAGWKFGFCSIGSVDTVGANSGYDSANPRPTITVISSGVEGYGYINGVLQGQPPTE